MLDNLREMLKPADPEGQVLRNVLAKARDYRKLEKCHAQLFLEYTKKVRARTVSATDTKDWSVQNSQMLNEMQEAQRELDQAIILVDEFDGQKEIAETTVPARTNTASAG